MTKPKFKSDDRPSDTKSVVLNKGADARLLDHLKRTKGESTWWRKAGYFYLDFMAWLASQEDAPEPDQEFVYYQAYLEQRRTQPVNSQPAAIDPDAIRQVITDSLADHLADVRQVVQSVLDTALDGVSIAGAAASDDALDHEIIDLLDSLDVSLEVDEL
jgi:hypothetical protein